jgi:hypothetical protein
MSLCVRIAKSDREFAGHSLSVANGERMAPGVFDTLRAWLLTRVQTGR